MVGVNSLDLQSKGFSICNDIAQQNQQKWRILHFLLCSIRHFIFM
jgi:hypothetical protein